MPTAVFKTCSFCGKEAKEKELENHELICREEEVECGNKCGLKLPRQMLSQHVKESCRKRKVVCDLCKGDILHEDLEDHKVQCSQQVVECELKCGVQTERCNMSKHIAENCSKSLITCFYCGQEVKKNNIEDHAKKCGGSKCLCDECGKKVQEEYMSYHLKERCMKRLIQCVFCDASTVADLLPEHLETCEDVPVRCERKCGKKLPRKKIGEHLQECPKIIVVCDYCEKEFESELLEDHHADCVKYPIPCPESSGVEVAREEVERHLDEECQKEKCVMRVVQCFFCDSFVLNYSLDKHYDICESALVRCGNKCGVKISRIDLSEHYRNECPKALIVCAHCEKKVERQLLKDHHEECVKFPIPCPESCGVEVAREEVERHLDEECQKRFAACAYKEMQCSYEGFPAGMTQHVKEDMGHHVNLIKGFVENLKMELESERKRNGELQMEINVLRHGSLLWKVEDIAEKIDKAKNDSGHRVYSPPFYSSKHGYKLRLEMNPCRYYPEHKSNLGVYIQVMPGEYDSILKWPFTKLVKFRLVNQSTDGEDIVKSIRGCDIEGFIKPKDGKCNTARGYATFVSHVVLNSRSYVVDNAIFLEVSVEE